MSTAASTESQLVVIPKDTALAVFSTDKAIDPFLARIRKEIDAFVPDVDTVKGRKAIASMAYTVAQTKTYLESVGKALADEQKEIPKKIDASRKKVRETLDSWRDEVRKPLTDWEAAEDARIKAHTDAITVLNELSRTAQNRDSAGLRESLSRVDAVIVGPSCEEFEADYARAKDAARASLAAELPLAEKREADAAELVRLRAESEAREKLQREEDIRREAALEATRTAEAAAQSRLDEEAARTRAAQEEAALATRRAAETEARLKQEAEDEANRVAAETRRREADKEHRATINRAALAAFVAGGLTPEVAKQALILIASRSIPAVTIFY